MCQVSVTRRRRSRIDSDASPRGAACPARWSGGRRQAQTRRRAAVRDAQPADVRLRLPRRRPRPVPRGDRPRRRPRSACCSRSRCSATPRSRCCLTTRADRFGRRRTLFLGLAADARRRASCSPATPCSPCSLVAATLGVISPSGNEVGPFLAIEQASLAQLVDARRPDLDCSRGTRSPGSVATALGLARRGRRHAGGPRRRVRAGRRLPGRDRRLRRRRRRDGVRVPAALAGRRGPGRGRRSPGVARPTTRLGLHKSRGIVARLSALFALDAFGGGFVMPELHRLLAHQRSSGPTPRMVGGDPVRGQHPGRVLGAGGRAARGALRARSGRWCSRTCRRTCC